APLESAPRSTSLEFGGSTLIAANAAVAMAGAKQAPVGIVFSSVVEMPNGRCGNATIQSEVSEVAADSLPNLGSLRPLGQIRESFILAVDQEGLWIIDQHVAHERVLFEKVLRQRNADRVEQQRLLMPMIVELTPAQQAVFAEISEELRHNGFDVELFGSRTVAIKAAPAGIEAADMERTLYEVLDQIEREQQRENLDAIRHRIAASIACHAAIKINTRLEQNKMEWLLAELARTECPMTCPHGRPVVLRYSIKEIEKAFKRI